MDIKKLQALVVDALEDVKAQDIHIYDTTHLTSMFDRIAVASGTSNRQTKALAASVRDKVKAAGGHIVNMEGETTGEWVLVDLGDMVVHIMQPTIRQYYHLEEIWGDKPVRIKLGAAKPQPVVKAVATPIEAPKKAARQPAQKGADTKVAAKKGAVKTASSKKPVAKKAVAKSAAAKKPAAKKSPPRKSKP